MYYILYYSAQHCHSKLYNVTNVTKLYNVIIVMLPKLYIVLPAYTV